MKSNYVWVKALRYVKLFCHLLCIFWLPRKKFIYIWTSAREKLFILHLYLSLLSSSIVAIEKNLNSTTLFITKTGELIQQSFFEKSNSADKKPLRWARNEECEKNDEEELQRLSWGFPEVGPLLPSVVSHAAWCFSMFLTEPVTCNHIFHIFINMFKVAHFQSLLIIALISRTL